MVTLTLYSLLLWMEISNQIQALTLPMYHGKAMIHPKLQHEFKPSSRGKSKTESASIKPSYIRRTLSHCSLRSLTSSREHMTYWWITIKLYNLTFWNLDLNWEVHTKEIQMQWLHPVLIQFKQLQRGEKPKVVPQCIH